jgi:uncharacterized cupredoxin-like copper-binding protein
MRGKRFLAVLGLVALLSTLGLVLAACNDNGGTQPTPTPDEGAAHEDEEDAGNHADSDGNAEANAYLEAAPKDTLYLVEMTSFAFEPDVLEANTGEVIEIAVQNAEPVLHDFTIDKIDADVHVSYLGGTGQHLHAEPEKVADVHFALTEPGSGIVHLKIHEPGEYVFYCTVPGHREGGMEGKLIVN